MQRNRKKGSRRRKGIISRIDHNNRIMGGVDHPLATRTGRIMVRGTEHGTAKETGKQRVIGGGGIEI